MLLSTTVIPVSTIIQAGIPESLQQPATVLEPTTSSSEPPIAVELTPPKILTTPEAIPQLDDSAIFIQSFSFYALFFPYAMPNTGF